jgi:hypothetical protein
MIFRWYTSPCLVALALSQCGSTAMASSVVVLFPHNPGAPVPPDLTGTLSVSPSTASLGTRVRIGLTLTDTGAVNEAVMLTISVAYQSPSIPQGPPNSGTLSTIRIGPLDISAGETIAPTFSFVVPWFVPPGTYTVGVTATDATGAVGGTADLTITP